MVIVVAITLVVTTMVGMTIWRRWCYDSGIIQGGGDDCKIVTMVAKIWVTVAVVVALRVVVVVVAMIGVVMALGTTIWMAVAVMVIGIMVATKMEEAVMETTIVIFLLK